MRLRLELSDSLGQRKCWFFCEPHHPQDVPIKSDSHGHSHRDKGSTQKTQATGNSRNSNNNSYKIRDLCAQVMETLGLSTAQCPNGIVLELKGYELLPSSPVFSMLRDNDAVVVKPNNSNSVGAAIQVLGEGSDHHYYAGAASAAASGNKRSSRAWFEDNEHEKDAASREDPHGYQAAHITTATTPSQNFTKRQRLATTASVVSTPNSTAPTSAALEESVRRAGGGDATSLQNTQTQSLGCHSCSRLSQSHVETTGTATATPSFSNDCSSGGAVARSTPVISSIGHYHELQGSSECLESKVPRISIFGSPPASFSAQYCRTLSSLVNHDRHQPYSHQNVMQNGTDSTHLASAIPAAASTPNTATPAGNNNNNSSINKNNTKHYFHSHPHQNQNDFGSPTQIICAQQQQQQQEKILSASQKRRLLRKRAKENKQYRNGSFSQSLDQSHGHNGDDNNNNNNSSSSSKKDCTGADIDTDISCCCSTTVGKRRGTDNDGHSNTSLSPGSKFANATIVGVSDEPKILGQHQHQHHRQPQSIPAIPAAVTASTSSSSLSREAVLANLTGSQLASIAPLFELFNNPALIKSNSNSNSKPSAPSTTINHTGGGAAAADAATRTDSNTHQQSQHASLKNTSSMGGGEGNGSSIVTTKLTATQKRNLRKRRQKERRRQQNQADSSSLAIVDNIGSSSIVPQSKPGVNIKRDVKKQQDNESSSTCEDSSSSSSSSNSDSSDSESESTDESSSSEDSLSSLSDSSSSDDSDDDDNDVDDEDSTEGISDTESTSSRSSWSSDNEVKLEPKKSVSASSQSSQSHILFDQEGKETPIKLPLTTTAAATPVLHTSSSQNTASSILINNEKLEIKDILPTPETSNNISYSITKKEHADEWEPGWRNYYYNNKNQKSNNNDGGGNEVQFPVQIAYNHYIKSINKQEQKQKDSKSEQQDAPEITSSSNLNKNKKPGPNATTTATTTTTGDATINYDSYPLVSKDQLPTLIDATIAYKHLILGEDFCPAVSDYVMAKVITVIQNQDKMFLELQSLLPHSSSSGLSDNFGGNNDENKSGIVEEEEEDDDDDFNFNKTLHMYGSAMKSWKEKQSRAKLKISAPIVVVENNKNNGGQEEEIEYVTQDLLNPSSTTITGSSSSSGETIATIKLEWSELIEPRLISSS
ncbi:hypothetical protein H4219_005635 [Mycoemilia scoparia]|uniref:Uncharacterized protein n=1 Tax=Mycoemilia scoparia TaxID=417184 RepID=A0A9W8DPQ1_9FUNG|nr:hypothetical protein H4219_005635 [Mycoemilia scoparia]